MSEISRLRAISSLSCRSAKNSATKIVSAAYKLLLVAFSIWSSRAELADEDHQLIMLGVDVGCRERGAIGLRESLVYRRLCPGFPNERRWGSVKQGLASWIDGEERCCCLPMGACDARLPAGDVLLRPACLAPRPADVLQKAAD